MRPFLIASITALGALASAAEDDPYRVDAPPSAADSAAGKIVVPDSVVRPDSLPQLPAKEPSVAPAPMDSAGARKARPRLVRETTVNPLNAVQGRYRSPKQALFMSLVVPGLGQAYVGHSTLNYARAVAYFGVDVTLGILWYQYVVVKHDRQVAKYRRFADENWSEKRYEDSLSLNLGTPQQFEARNPNRESYCDAVQEKITGSGNYLHIGCVEPIDSVSLYNAFKSQFANLSDSADSVHARRAGFPNVFYFYELIGKEQEFLAGWKDADSVRYADSSITGASALRDGYVAMRNTANRYARMQAWFLGGIVLNHIASALDAALTARAHNKSLYQKETRWYDRVRIEGGLAFDAGPRTNLTASLSF